MFPAGAGAVVFLGGETGVDSWTTYLNKKNNKKLRNCNYPFFYLASPKGKNERISYVAYVFEDRLWVATSVWPVPMTSLRNSTSTKPQIMAVVVAWGWSHRSIGISIKKMDAENHFNPGQKKHSWFIHIFKLLPFWCIFTSQQKNVKEAHLRPSPVLGWCDQQWLSPRILSNKIIAIIAMSDSHLEATEFPHCWPFSMFDIIVAGS